MKQDLVRSNLLYANATWTWSSSDEYYLNSWGFDVRNPKVKGKDRVLVSFSSTDQTAHPDWARFIIGAYDASYQVVDSTQLDPPMKDGHTSWAWHQSSGLFLTQLATLGEPEQQSMNGVLNGYWQGEWKHPVPADFTVEIKK